MADPESGPESDSDHDSVPQSIPDEDRSSESDTGPPTEPLCNTFFEEFLDVFQSSNVTSMTDLCPGCGNMGVRHARRGTIPQPTATSESKSSVRSMLSAVSKAFMALEKQLPTYSKSVDVRNYLRNIELVLKTNTGIPITEWPRVFLYTVKESSSSLEWILANIIDKQLDWKRAKEAFTLHFQKAEYGALLLKKFYSCKQGLEESVQNYSDRFREICIELERDGYDSDPLVIDHYLKHLNRTIRQKYDDYLCSQRILQCDVEWSPSSLATIMQICIIYDVGYRTSVSTTAPPSSHPKSSQSSESKSNTTSKEKSKVWCSFHKSKTHNTADCRKAKENKGKKSSESAAKPATKSKDLSQVLCYKCGQHGHYANVCTDKSGKSLSQPNSQSSQSNQSKRSNAGVPPARLTYDTPGQPTQKSSSVNAISHASSRPALARIWFHDPERHCTYATLLDTGSDVSFIDSSLAAKLKLETRRIQGTIQLAQAGVTTSREAILVSPFQVNAILTENNDSCIIKPIQHSFETMKLDTNKYHFIVGKDLLSVLFPDYIPSSFYAQLNSSGDSLVSAIQVCRIATVTSSLVENVSVNNVKLLDEMAETGFTSLPAEEIRERALVSTPESLEEEYGRVRAAILNDPQIKEAMQINENISGFCSLDDSVVKLNVHPDFLKNGFRKQYKVPKAAEEAVDAQVLKWFESGKIILAPTNCPYNSSLTVAAKKDSYGNFNGWRVCLDTRALNNNLLVEDKFQLPYIRDVLERFQGCVFFGELDLSEAYLQFQLHPDSQQYTAFTWRGKQYCFKGCPFGISLLPSYFQRIMCGLFNDLSFTYPYLDNLPFGSVSPAEHQQHLLLLLQRCNQFNLKVKLSAMKVSHSSMHCLGHLLTKQGVALSPSKIEFIKNAERPVTGKQLQSFLGAVTFLRSNVRHIAELTASLEAVKNTTGELHWTERMLTDFELLKTAIAKAPALAYPDFTRPFHLATDASNVGIGGVLYQPEQPGGDITADNIVAVVSKKLSGSQLNYSAYKKELYAIIYCLRKLHYYIWGQPGFIIFTDHKPLTHLLQQPQLSPAVQQWLDVLLDYQFEIRYREGKLNVLPDHLSRIYASEYENSAAWGVPSSWKVPSSTAIVAAATTSLMGGGDDPSSSSNTISNSDELVEQLIEMEKRGYTIPDVSERAELIQKEHDFGHFGITAICSGLIAKQLWWKGMRTQVAEVLSNCDACARFNVVKSGFNPAAFITSSGPWKHIQVDTSTHLPAAPGGYTSLLAVIDVFTGFIVLRAMKSTTAEVVANELWNIFCILGVPEILQTDNGTEYTNDTIRCLTSLTGIEHRFISPYNPRADGKIERSFRTTMAIIKKLLHGDDQNWHLYVPFAQLAFNNKVASLTGSTPFSLMFARNLNPIRDYTTDDPDGTLINIQDWKQHMEKVQSLIYPAILERTLNKKNEMIKRLDKTRRVITEKAFPVGSIVMLRDPMRSTKFEPKYVGPYTIVRRTRNGNLSLRDETGDILDRNVPPDQLKMIRKKPNESDLETAVYEVQSIEGHRGSPNNYEYLTKWKNYSQRTWEPATSFRDTALINDYWKTHTP